MSPGGLLVQDQASQAETGRSHCTWQFSHAASSVVAVPTYSNHPLTREKWTVDKRHRFHRTGRMNPNTWPERSVLSEPIHQLDVWADVHGCRSAAAQHVEALTVILVLEQTLLNRWDEPRPVSTDPSLRRYRATEKPQNRFHSSKLTAALCIGCALSALCPQEETNRNVQAAKHRAVECYLTEQDSQSRCPFNLHATLG